MVVVTVDPLWASRQSALGASSTVAASVSAQPVSSSSHFGASVLQQQHRNPPTMSLPPSSPRLPSPPPAAEIQVTPNSPSGGPAATLQATEMEQTVIDANSKRRIHPGTKSADMATGPPLVPLAEVCIQHHGAVRTALANRADSLNLLFLSRSI